MRKRVGFTILEIMIVMVIIVLIGAISITSWFNMTQNICGKGTLRYVAQAMENMLIKARYDSFQKKDVITVTFRENALEISSESAYIFPDEITLIKPAMPQTYLYNRGYFTTDQTAPNPNTITPEASFVLVYSKGGITNEQTFTIMGGLPLAGVE